MSLLDFKMYPNGVTRMLFEQVDEERGVLWSHQRLSEAERLEFGTHVFEELVERGRPPRGSLAHEQLEPTVRLVAVHESMAALRAAEEFRADRWVEMAEDGTVFLYESR